MALANFIVPLFIVAVDTTIIGNGKTVGEVHGKSEQNVTESEIPTPPVFSSGPQSTFFLETKPQPPATTEIISASSELQLNRTFPPIIGTPETFYPGLGQVSFLPATFELQPNMVHHIKLESTPASNVTKGQTAAGGLKEATTQEQINTTASLFTEEPEQTAYTVPLQLANGTIKPVAKTSTTTEKTTTKQESHNETVKTTAKTAKAEILTTESAVIVNGSVPLGSIPAGLKTAINVGPSEPGTKTSNSPLNQQPPNPLAAFPEISSELVRLIP